MKTVLATLALLLTAGALSLAQAPNDPAAWWRLDETSGTTAADAGPNGNNGTLVGFATPNWVPGQFGNALQFAGAATYVNITPINNGLPIYNRRRYSVAAWVNGPPQGDRRVYSEGDALNNSPLFTLGSGGSSSVSSAKLRVFVRADNGGNRLVVESVNDVFDNTWHHFAWVDNDGVGRIYVDGQLDTTVVYDPSSLTITRIAIGAVLRGTAGNFLTGAVDELRTYPFCLTQTDVEAIRLLNAPIGSGYQLNQPGAELAINGEWGSPATPALTIVAQSTTFGLRMASTAGGYQWELAGTPTAPVANYIPLTQNILNINIAHPNVFFVNGGFMTTFGPPIGIPGFPTSGYATAVELALTAPAAPMSVSLQFGIADPASADGLSLSAPVQLVVN